MESMQNVRTLMEVTTANAHLAFITTLQDHAKVGRTNMKCILDRHCL